MTTKQTKAMPKNKNTPKIISEELAIKCRKLIDLKDKRVISNSTGFSVAYIDSIISGKRFNKKIISALEKKVNSIIKELSK